MTAPEAAFLSVRGLSKYFGAVSALADVDLDVARGSFTCLIGPSGCGKTTLLRIVCGIETASGGSVHCVGQNISHLPPALRRMGMVFQSYALFPNLRVAQNIAFGLPRDLSKAEKQTRVAALLETVGLSGYERRRPDELSGGQQQRVAIARALAPEPAILLLDEPLSALDPQVRAHLRGELRALQRKLGITAIMVTHDQAEALAIADNIAVMQQGRIVQTGAPFDLYNHPKNRFVAGFLGSMNFLGGRVAGNGAVELLSGEIVEVPTRGLAKRTAVEIGIRPEDIRICEAGDPATPDMILRVNRCEFSGATVQLETISVDTSLPQTLRIETRDTRIGEGTLLRVMLPPKCLHLFQEQAA
jgi:iron(III) transport system ATP-binding protein